MSHTTSQQNAPIAEPLAGRFLRHHRTAAGIGLRELALEVGYSHAYLSQIENEKRTVPVSTVALIAATIGKLAATKSAA